MGLLKRTSIPAEVRRGMVIDLDFSDAGAVTSQNGSVVGSPRFRGGWGKYGVELDGSSDYLTYNLTGQEFNSAEISIVMDFIPDFDYDNGVSHYLFDTTSGLRWYVRKDSNDDLYVYSQAATLIITAAEYSDYWRANKRNVLVFAADSSLNDITVWLNGVRVKQDLGWTHYTRKPTGLWVGSAYDGTVWFDGTISSFKIFQSLLTEQEAKDYYDAVSHA